MKMHHRAIILAAMALTGQIIHAATPVPLALPSPDGKPGVTNKPVRVYILAGQSNMVGMGDISGARPPNPNLFLAADPAIIPGVTPISGEYDSKPIARVAVAHHGVFEAKGAVLTSPDEVAKPTIPVALGTASENLPVTEGAQTIVISAEIDVPLTGFYTVHAGFGESSHNVVLLDGKEVYRKDIGGKPVITKVTLEKGKRYPVRISYFKAGSAAFWLEQVDIEGKGDLVTLTKKDKKFPYLLDAEGNWTVRNDVFYTDPRLFPTRAVTPLSATSNNGKSIGPELGFGHVMGTFHDEQVLLIKTSMGNRSLGFDFRPPSSGRNEPDSEWEGLEYRLMVKGVRETLKNIEKVVPGYAGQGYEIAGFGWFQGHKDSGSTKEAYEKNLVNLIGDLRKEFNVPKMPAVVATVGFHGYRLQTGSWQGVWEAQMAVGDTEQHPESKGNVVSVDTRDFWRELEESPANQDYHYHRNPETYLLIGEAMGRAMVNLADGDAVTIPKTDREKLAAERVAVEAAEAAKPAPTEKQKSASRAAIKPMILDGTLATYIANPRNQALLEAARTMEKQAKEPPYLLDAIDDVVLHYQAAGIPDYDWKQLRVGPDEGNWDYIAFDLPATHDRKLGGMTLPAGLESWFSTDFDGKKAGWKNGEAPFGGKKNDPGAPPTPDWYEGPARSSFPVNTACENDVLLLRKSFDLPLLEDDHRYRIRVGGSMHANSGEGFAIYANGKLLAESKAGVTAWRREGKKPRGGYIRADFRGDFKGGKVTIAVATFPMNNRAADYFIPPGRALSVWFEEMKLPPSE
jgi:hypothetical protein